MKANLIFDLANHEGLGSRTGMASDLVSMIEHVLLTVHPWEIKHGSLTADASGIRREPWIEEEPISSTGNEFALLDSGEGELGASTETENAVSLSGITAQITELFHGAREEVFEDGMMSDFIARLLKMISLYEAQAIEAIHDLLEKPAIGAETKGEALRWLGEVEQASTYFYRRWLLERHLIAEEGIAVVDGANVGLSVMDDPHSIPCFRKAIEQSRTQIVRRLLKLTLVQLEETKRAKAVEEDQGGSVG